MEIWKTIEDYPDYQISNMGRVKSLKWGKEKILKSTLNKNGYCNIFLCKNKEIKYYYIHRLVAQAFIQNPYNLPQVNHINEIKTDNRVENLEWCTNEYNSNYSKAKPILQFSKEGDFIKKWDSTREVERELNFNQSNISSCCLGKLNTAYNYKWGYEEDFEKIPFKIFDLEIYRKIN